MGSMAKTATRTSRSTCSTAPRFAVLAQNRGISTGCSRISIPYSRSSGNASGGYWQRREIQKTPGRRQRRVFPSWILIHPVILSVFSDFTFHVLLILRNSLLGRRQFTRAWNTPLPSERAISSLGSRLRFLFRRNGKILETSALLGNIEGHRRRRSAAAGILHVVHFAGDSGESLAGLQGHSGLALRLKDHRTVLDIHDLVA